MRHEGTLGSKPLDQFLLRQKVERLPHRLSCHTVFSRKIPNG
jgi:hypothetical protein